ncbi:MAG: InlB B-repeat-containing protein, partial [Clostridiales bacterium]|nr:InlB B-repeat-containing protein [Clostridiales bacterium]
MVKHRVKYIVAVLLAVILMFGLMSGYVMQASATESTYTVTFTFDGTEIISESVNKGESVTTVPAADSQTGYTITGWYIKGLESKVYSSSEVAAFRISAPT